jgi:PIN domain nuclease of toxin-antitoxin system
VLALPAQSLIALKRAKQELHCANEALQPYIVSSQATIKASALIAVRAIAELQIAADKEVAVTKKLLEDIDAAHVNRQTQSSGSQITEALSNVAVQEDSAWELFVKATEGAFYPLVDQAALDAANKAPESQRSGWERLVITTAQRRQLLAALEDAFGPEVKGAAMAKGKDHTSVQQGAALLYQLIAAPNWRAKDE